MDSDNEIILSTKDLDLAKGLATVDIPNVRVCHYGTRAVEIQPIARFAIEFLTGAAVVAFAAWLDEFLDKKKAKDITINDREIPQQQTQIVILINNVLHAQKDDSKKEQDE